VNESWLLTCGFEVGEVIGKTASIMYPSALTLLPISQPLFGFDSLTISPSPSHRQGALTEEPQKKDIMRAVGEKRHVTVSITNYTKVLCRVVLT